MTFPTAGNSNSMAQVQNEPSGRLMDAYHELVSTSEDGANAVTFSLDTLRPFARPGSPISALFGENPQAQSGASPSALQTAFAQTARHVADLRRVLEQATEVVSLLHSANEQRLLAEARAALLNGMRTTGRDRTENLRDALGLLQAVQSSAVGGRDYVIWFNIGWLQWKLQEGLSEAEEAFYQAARLSASVNPAFQAYSLRHLAYMQFLRGQVESAADTVRRARTLAPNDAGILYDNARYAARVGNEAEAVSLLKSCFEQDPLVFAFAFGEDDFSAPDLATKVADLVTIRQSEALRDAQHDSKAWTDALASSHEVSERAGLSLELAPELAQDEANAAQTALHQPGLDYFTLLATREQVRGKAGQIHTFVQERLATTSASLGEQTERLSRQIENILQSRKQWQQTMKHHEDEARQAGFPLTEVRGVALMKLRMQKIEHRYNNARMSYEAAKENLKQAEAQIKTQVPTLHENIRRLKEQRAKIDEARQWLETQK